MKTAKVRKHWETSRWGAKFTWGVRKPNGGRNPYPAVTPAINPDCCLPSCVKEDSDE